MDYKWHILAALTIRLGFITYGMYHDEVNTVPYTDIDYKVFTDASRHILENGSPYDRHTYRYSPLLAILLIPNIIFHGCFGKVIFSLIDLLVGILIRIIVKDVINKRKQHDNVNISKTDRLKMEKLLSASDCTDISKNFKNIMSLKNSKQPSIILSHEECKDMPTEKTKGMKTKKLEAKRGETKILKSEGNTHKDEISKLQSFKSEANNYRHKDTILELYPDLSLIVWLYNPMSIAISTRGNCDSLAGFLVLVTLYFLQCKNKYFIAGLMHGISIHFRLYPIIYSLALYLHLSNYATSACSEENIHTNLKETKVKPESSKKINKIFYLVPNLNQMKLVLGCFLSLSILTSLCYYLYGYNFLYETYLYHLIRKDTRHNFSIFFYLQYLTAGANIGIWQSVLIVIPQVVLFIALSVSYGLNKFSLNFAVLTLTIVMVAYNTVLTSQYFIWILCILPLCLWQINIKIKQTIFLVAIWFVAQGLWLLPAYYIEFKGQNVFLFLWVQSISFFCANIIILGRLIVSFKI